jgi:hypothetical protein
MINARQLSEVIESTLKQYESLGGARYSDEARELLLMVAAHESNQGSYLFQMAGGPAIGIYQHERNTIRDLYKHFITKNRKVDFAVACFVPNRKSFKDGDTIENCITDIRYATVLARAHFQRYPEPLPTTGELALAAYAKKYWATEEGKASIADYVHAYRRAKAQIR